MAQTVTIEQVKKCGHLRYWIEVQGNVLSFKEVQTTPLNVKVKVMEWMQWHAE